MSIFVSSVAIVLTIVACVAGAPTVQGGNQPFEQTIYSSPELAEAQARYYDKIGRPDFQNYETIIREGFVRPVRRSLDSLSGKTFGESKRFQGLNPRDEYEAKIQRYLARYGPTSRNMDVGEKRNFDEIDRSNFNSFVKRDVNENGNQHVRQNLNIDELALVGLGSRSYDRRLNANDFIATTRR